MLMVKGVLGKHRCVWALNHFVENFNHLVFYHSLSTVIAYNFIKPSTVKFIFWLAKQIQKEEEKNGL